MTGTLDQNRHASLESIEWHDNCNGSKEETVHPQTSDISGKEGMVSSDNALASQVGRDILAQGGNAVDAAVATALALCVVKPASNGIGGYGGCMVIHLAREVRTLAIDYNCRAPMAATPDMYQVEDSERRWGLGEFPPIVGNANFVGPLAVTVPGTVAGLYLAESTFGRLGWGRVVEPAIRLAADGFPVWPGLQSNLQALMDGTDPKSAKTMFPDGKVPQEGEIWIQPDLACLLTDIASNPDGFYRGKIARKIVRRVRSMGGILSEEDMASYRAQIVQPLEVIYRGYRIYGPPGTTGAPTALQILTVLQQLRPEPYGVEDWSYWADLADTLVLVWKDRFEYLGDVPGLGRITRWLLSERHARKHARRIRRGPVAGRRRKTVLQGGTVSLVTCDAEHNMVACTQTHGGGWGARVGVPGLQIVLGHGMSRFDPRPGLPNSPGPGKAPLHNMSPLIVIKEGKPLACFGLPGGRMIPNIVAQFAVSLLDCDMSPAEALNRPRIHTHLAGMLVEKELPDRAREAMCARGHVLEERESLGGLASCIRIRGKKIIGASNAGPEASAAL